MFKVCGVLIACCISIHLHAQSGVLVADSIRQHYHIPELAYAVLSSDSVYDLQVLGDQRTEGHFPAHREDRFRIGSNTKAITCFIAAQLVKKGLISWNTHFFDLFPELKAKSNKAYHSLSLQDLLSFRARLFAYTYTYEEPRQEQFSGTEAEQRYQFANWFFQQKPVSGKGELHFSNLGYIAAGLMLEKASGQSYKTLVQQLGTQLNIRFGFGAPNSLDSLQPWGHDAALQPEPPGDNFKLNWLLAAGNINVNLPDYVKFIQLQLQGLRGQSSFLSKEEFHFLHFGLPEFALGWFWALDEQNQPYSFNTGNPGSFLSKVYVFPDSNKAFIFFSNSQTNDTEAGLNALYERLKKTYK